AAHLVERARGLARRARDDGHVRVLHRARHRRPGVDPDHLPRARSRGDLPRHRRDIRTVQQRGARRPGDPRPARRGGARHQVRAVVAPHGERGARFHAGRHPHRPGRVTAAARHRSRRPLLPAPGRPPGGDRGGRRRAGRVRPGGQGAAHRPVRGVGRHHPACARSAPDHRPADRVLAVDAGRGGGHPPHPAGARDRVRRLLAAGPRVPDRADHLAGRLRRRRLPQDQPALPGRELPAEPAARRRSHVDRRGCRRDTRPGGSGLAALPRERHRRHPRHQAGRPARGERRGRHRAARRRDAAPPRRARARRRRPLRRRRDRQYQPL
ncbi:MAG: Oxidoreductase, aldo/keto reductase family, partial [uncultured Blastococcus sp.]